VTSAQTSDRTPHAAMCAGERWASAVGGPPTPKNEALLIKRLSLVQRAASTGPHQFATEWASWMTELRAALPVGSRPRRIIHCITRPSSSAQPFDGVAMTWFDSETDLAVHDRLREGLPNAPFDRTSMTEIRVTERAVVVDDEIPAWRQGGNNDSKLVLLSFIQRKAGTTRGQFATYWWEAHRPLADKIVPLNLRPSTFFHNYVDEGESVKWDGIAEMYDRSIEVARARKRWVRLAEAVQIAEDEGRFMHRATVLGIAADAHVILPG